MPVKKLTARFVETIKGNGVERVDYRDAICRGLELRITPSGRKSWTLIYRTEKGRGARRRRMALGDFPAVDLDKARTIARVHLGMVAGGADPAADLQRASDRLTVRDMGDDYLEKHAKRNKRSWRYDKSILEADVYPVIGKLRPRDVERVHIQKIVDRVLDRGAAIQANRTFEIVRGLFRWGLGAYVDQSPCYGLRKPTRERPRERVLTRDELRTVWQRIERGTLSDTGDAVRMGEALQITVKLLLALGQRSGEVSQARREELDLKAGIWVIPGERSKNGRAHRLPLPDCAITLFQRAIEIGDEQFAERKKRDDGAKPTPWLFPSPFGRNGREWGTEPIGNTAINHALVRVLQYSGAEDVTPHDFRRTVATYMAELGIPEIHISAVMNHVRAGVTAKHYARYTYEAEKKAALEKWTAELRSIIDRTDKQTGCYRKNH